MDLLAIPVIKLSEVRARTSLPTSTIVEVLEIHVPLARLLERITRVRAENVFTNAFQVLSMHVESVVERTRHVSVVTVFRIRTRNTTTVEYAGETAVPVNLVSRRRTASTLRVRVESVINRNVPSLALPTRVVISRIWDLVTTTLTASMDISVISTVHLDISEGLWDA